MEDVGKKDFRVLGVTLRYVGDRECPSKTDLSTSHILESPGEGKKKVPVSLLNSNILSCFLRIRIWFSQMHFSLKQKTKQANTKQTNTLLFEH